MSEVKYVSFGAQMDFEKRTHELESKIAKLCIEERRLADQRSLAKKQLEEICNELTSHRLRGPEQMPLFDSADRKPAPPAPLPEEARPRHQEQHQTDQPAEGGEGIVAESSSPPPAEYDPWREHSLIKVTEFTGWGPEVHKVLWDAGLITAGKLDQVLALSGLAFNRAIAEAEKIAKAAGVLLDWEEITGKVNEYVDSCEGIPPLERPQAEVAEVVDPEPGPTDEEVWRCCDIASLAHYGTPAKTLELLRKGGVTSIGDVSDCHTAQKWPKGIGEGKAEAIVSALHRFLVEFDTRCAADQAELDESAAEQPETETEPADEFAEI